MVRRKQVPKKFVAPSPPPVSTTKVTDLPGDVFASMGLSRQDTANLARSSKELRGRTRQGGLLTSQKEKRNVLAKRRIDQFMNPGRESATDKIMGDSFPPVRVDERTAMRGRRIPGGRARDLGFRANLTLKPVARRIARTGRITKRRG